MKHFMKLEGGDGKGVLRQVGAAARTMQAAL